MGISFSVRLHVDSLVARARARGENNTSQSDAACRKSNS